MLVTVLGPVGCRHEGHDLELGGLKQRAVLALLVLEAGRTVPADRLVDEVWPQDPPASAVVTLRAYVSRLRRVLAPTPARITTRAPGWVLTLPEGATDVGRFVDLVARGRAGLAGTSNPDGPDGARTAVRDLAEALALWQGPALADLSGFRFAEVEAARLEELKDAALEALLESTLAAGDHEGVVEQARTFVAERPYRERAWLALMVALYRTGRQAEALEAAATLRRTLADDLGLDPSPAVQDLEHRMLNHHPSLRPPSGALPAATSSPDLRTADGLPLVGRERPLAVLRSAVAAAAAGRGGLVTLSAPTGAGKTTVLRAVGEHVVATGGRVLHGRGLADGAAPALWPWTTALAELTDVLPALVDDLRLTDDPAAAALTALAPGVDRDGAGTAVPLSRTLLFRGIIDVLRAARRSAPLVVVVDDAHWADADSRTLLALATRELAGDGVLFLAAERTDEPAISPHSPRSPLAVVPRELTTRVRLDPLDADDVARVITAVDSQPPGSGVAAAVVDQTGGNALFVTELVKLLSAEGRLTSATVGGRVPAEVGEVLRRRLERLPVATRAVLDVAGLLAAAPFEVGLLAAVCGSSDEETLDACESALVAGLLVEVGEHGGRIALSHGLLRETLVARLSGARRVHLHAKIAAALEQRGPQQPDEVLEVARQLVLAAPAVGPAAAVPYLVSAADDALRRSATDTSCSLLATALDLVADIADPRLREGSRALVQGHLDTVRLWAATLGDEAPPTRPSAPVDGPSAGAWVGTVVGWAVRGHYGWAVDEADHLIASRPVQVVENAARYVRAVMSVVRDDRRTARQDLDHLRAAISDTSNAGLPDLLFSFADDVVAYRALIAHEEGDDDAADAELVELGRWSPTSEAAQVKIDYYLSLVAAMRGRHGAARASARRSQALARRLRFRVFEHQLDVVGAWADALDGDPTAPGRADAALERHRETGVRFFEPSYLLLVAEAYAAVGDPATARTRVNDALASAEAHGEHYRGPRLADLAERLSSAVGV